MNITNKSGDSDAGACWRTEFFVLPCKGELACLRWVRPLYLVQINQNLPQHNGQFMPVPFIGELPLQQSSKLKRRKMLLPMFIGRFKIICPERFISEISFSLLRYNYPTAVCICKFRKRLSARGRLFRPI